jgi:hypothetical protein
MSIAFCCQACGKPYNVHDRLAGRKAHCKACGAVMVVQASAARAAMAATRSAGPAAAPARRRAAAMHARPKPPAPPPPPDDPFENFDALMALEASGGAAVPAPPPPPPPPPQVWSAAYAPAAPVAGPDGSNVWSLQYWRSQADPYVSIPGDKLIDTLVPWVPIGVALIFCIMSLVHAASSAGGGESGETSIALTKASSMVIGMALALAGMSAPLFLLGVFLASRIMKFQNRRLLYFKCLAAACTPVAVSFLLNGTRDNPSPPIRCRSPLGIKFPIS